MTHTCTVCGVTSDVSEFYKGVNCRCKECHKIKVRENRAQKAEYYRTYDAFRYQNDPKVKNRHKRYAKTERGKASLEASRKRWVSGNKEKRAAHTLLGNAIRDGRVVKPENCSECGACGRIEGHHDDYAKPLEVRWLCRSCHVAHHRSEDDKLSALREAAESFDASPKLRGRHA